MKTVRLFIVLALIFCGGILMALDYDATVTKWLALGTSALCFSLGVWLGWRLDKKNLLPE